MRWFGQLTSSELNQDQNQATWPSLFHFTTWPSPQMGRVTPCPFLFEGWGVSPVQFTNCQGIPESILLGWIRIFKLQRERENFYKLENYDFWTQVSTHSLGGLQASTALWILTVQPFHTEVTVCARKTTEPKNKVNQIAATSIPSSRWSLQQFPELPTSSLNVGTKLVLRVTPLEGAWSCGHLDFGLLPSRILSFSATHLLSFITAAPGN